MNETKNYLTSTPKYIQDNINNDFIIYLILNLVRDISITKIVLIILKRIHFGACGVKNIKVGLGANIERVMMQEILGWAWGKYSEGGDIGTIG